MTKSLPPRPDIEWLKKAAKERLAELRSRDPSAKLHQAQLEVARDYGFASWRALRAHVARLSVDGQVIRAAKDGHAAELAALLDKYPAKLAITGGSPNRPLLHHAAEAGHRDCVRVLLERGCAVGERDRLDHATALHWAAYAGRVQIVQQLLEAGADPNAADDVHEAGVIGWATALNDTHKLIGEMLLTHGAQPTIFSAVALGRADMVRALVDANPDLLEKTQSRFEHHRSPLHLAVMRNRSEMVRLLLELGADVGATDGSGATPLKYATSATDKAIIDILIQAGADPTERGNQFLGATPQLRVKSLPAAIAYFHDKLGFETEWEAGTIACVFRDQVYLFLTTERPVGASFVAVAVQDVDGLHEEYKTGGALVKSPPADRSWGGRVMNVECPDGNVLSFWK